jgi:hypothetical protein
MKGRSDFRGNSLSMNRPRKTQRFGADKDSQAHLCPPLIFGFPVFGAWP